MCNYKRNDGDPKKISKQIIEFQKLQKQKKSSSLYKKEKNNNKNDQEINGGNKQKFEIRSFFSRPEKNFFKKEDILRKKIYYLYFGFHPIYSKSSKLESFHPFFYAKFVGKPSDPGAIIEYGGFEADEDGRKECHYWGKDGLAILEKKTSFFETEYELICNPLVGDDFEFEKWALLVSDCESGPLPENTTLQNFLEKVDPNKD